ncbi:MAG TPA: SNF2-related protein [Candidatus Polarisedimenticolaceae bacterium]
MSWKTGDRVRHRDNPDLGPGRVLHATAREVVVEFPARGTTLKLAAATGGLVPLRLAPGTWARDEQTGDRVLIEAELPGGRFRLTGGRIAEGRFLWPLDVADSPVDLLAHGEIGSVEAFGLRLDALHLKTVREAEGLGSFLGGRIRLFPHQLYVAERATRTDPVRWLLADEVGLGKTVEACLILNHLVRVRRTERTLVVAPETLVVQWLGELWRKYHQVFVLLDEPRLADVAKDHGADFNPFDAHRQVVVSMETLVKRPKLTEQAVEAGIDLLIVDEAHHLQRAKGHPGNAAYRAIAPICALGRHVLLLTATPLEDDAHGFFRLLQLLRPEEFPEGESFEARLQERRPLPPCTSQTRRADIGGLPPRAPAPVTIDDPGGWEALRELERTMLELPAPHAVARRQKADKVARALASPWAIDAGAASRDAQAADPRVVWLADAAREWQTKRQKTLVFVAHRETLEALRAALSRIAQIRTGAFHEALSTAARDIEVAQFRTPAGPSLLISTECGGEGRNFEFCRRIVLFDLPWNPVQVEQRIGRLDRIGRTRDVEIVYFRPPSGLGASVAALYESIGLFREPLGGLERELAHVEQAVREAAADGRDTLPPDVLRRVVDEMHGARERSRAAAYHELHREPYRPELAEAILARVPADLEELTQDFVVSACEQLGLMVEPHRDGSVWSIAFGTASRVENLPGVPGDASFLGAFDREEAVADEALDFFASGHPLVEGLLAEIEDGRIGRTAILGVDGRGTTGFGLLAIYAKEGGFDAVCVDLHGKRRDDWAAQLTARPLRTRRIKTASIVDAPTWGPMVRKLAAALGREDRPAAAAAVVAL